MMKEIQAAIAPLRAALKGNYRHRFRHRVHAVY
jgi:hypothetical protein